MTCPYCTLDTGGNHELKCPSHPPVSVPAAIPGQTTFTDLNGVEYWRTRAHEAEAKEREYCTRIAALEEALRALTAGKTFGLSCMYCREFNPERGQLHSADCPVVVGRALAAGQRDTKYEICECGANITLGYGRLDCAECMRRSCVGPLTDTGEPRKDGA